MAVTNDDLRKADPFLNPGAALSPEHAKLREADPFLNPGGPKSDSSTLKDYGITAARGVVNATAGIGSLLDTFTPIGLLPGGPLNNQLAGMGLDFAKADQALASGYSPGVQAARQDLNQSMKGTDVWESAKGAAGAMWRNPQLVPHAVVESLPSLGISGGAGLLAKAGSRLLAGAIAEGAQSAGSVAEQIRRDNPAEYENAALYALPAGALTTGISLGMQGLGGNLAGRIAARMGGERGGELAGNALTRAFKGGLGEGSQEVLQSGQEQVFQNLGTNQTALEGVGGSMVQGGVAGAGMGIGLHPLMGHPPAAQPPGNTSTVAPAPGAQPPVITPLLPAPGITPGMQPDYEAQRQDMANRQEAARIYAERDAEAQRQQQINQEQTAQRLYNFEDSATASSGHPPEPPPGGGFPFNGPLSADFDNAAEADSVRLARRAPGPENPGQGVAEGNSLGFEPELRVQAKVGKFQLPEKPLILTGTTNQNAPRQIDNLDVVLKKNPDPTASPSAWSRMMAQAFATTDVPVPPYAFIRDINSDGAAAKISSLSPGQIQDADHGFQNAAQFRKDYVNGKLDVITTGKLFLWSFLSRGVSPYVQEGLFIDAFNGIDQWIRKAAAGNFTEADLPAYDAWARSAAPKGSGQPGAGATHNLNAFGKSFLLKMGRRSEDGKSNLDRLHTMMSDPNMTGPQIRREFAKFGEGVGIDNKVVSFTLLVSGHKDVMVIDRVQVKQLWDDGRFEGRNLYDGRTEKRVVNTPEGPQEKNVTVPGTALADLTMGARGLLVYEAIERGLQKKIADIYASAGRPQDASIGRYHWESWVAHSQQEASHGTIDAILRSARGDQGAINSVTAKQGEYGSYEYGARYGRDSANNGTFRYNVGQQEYSFNVPKFREFLDAIKNPKNGVVPRGFKVTEAGNAPWFNRPEVNQAKLGELAARYGTRSGSGSAGAGAVSGPLSNQAAADGSGFGNTGPGVGQPRLSRAKQTPENQDEEAVGKATKATPADIARLEKAAEQLDLGPASKIHPYEPAPLPNSAALSQIARALGARVAGFRISDSVSADQLGNLDVFEGLTYGDGLIFIQSDAPRPHMTILGHEFAHQLARQRPDLYKALVAAINSYVKDFDKFRNSVVAKDAGSKAAQTEEFIAEVFADGFMDPKFWKAVGQDNPSLLDKVVNFLVDLLSQIMPSLRGVHTRQYLSDYDKVIEMAAGTLAEYERGNKIQGMTKPSAARRGPNTNRQLTPEQETALGKAGVFYEQPNLKERLTSLGKQFKSSFIQGMFDQFRPLKDLSKKAYILARMAKASDGGLEAVLAYGKPTMDKDGAMGVDTSSGGFIRAMQKLEGEHDLFLAWVASKRAEELKKQGRENLFTDEDISALQTLNHGTMPSGRSRVEAYNEALSKLQEINRATLDIAQRSGLIDAESRTLWEQEFYVPFYRVVEDGVTGPTIKSGLVNQASIKKLKGGTQNLNDLMSNTMRNWAHLLGASAKNRAALVALKELQQTGGAIEAPEATLRHMKKQGATDNVVYVMDRGRQRWFTIEDPDMADALMSLERVNLPAFLKPAQVFKQLLTFGVTATPAFKVSNLIRDSISTIGQTKISANPFANLVQGAQALKNSDLYAQMLAGGALFKHGTSLEGDRARYIKKLIDAGVAPENILDSPAKVKAMASKVWGWYADLGDKSENLNRAALYQQLRDKGLSHLEASFEARDVMDFGLQGKWATVRLLTQVVPFMNARLQGLYKLGRASQDDRTRFAWTAAVVSLASLALMGMYRDDDDWKKREDWDRDAFWWIKVGGHAVYIPKPFELGSIGTLVERSAELMMDKEMTYQRYFKRLGSMLADTFSLSPVPQLVKPMIDVYSNKDAFTGRPIESAGMENLRPQDRASAGTSEVAKGLGKLGLPDPFSLAMNQYKPLSPVQIDQLMRGYMGGLAAGIQMVTDAMIRPLLGRPDKPAMRLEDYPLAGRFVKELPSDQSRYVTQFYDSATKIEEAYASYRDSLKRGDIAQAKQIFESERANIAQRAGASAIRQQLGAINRRIKMIQDQPNLDPAMKREQIDRLKQVMDQRARLFSPR